MENKRQTKPKGSTVHSGKRESFQVVGDSGGSISHRLRASQLLPSVSDDATVIYSHKNGEFVSTKYGSSYKGSDKTALGSSLCSQGQNPCEDISPVVTGIRVNACNGGTRMKLNIATQTNRLMRSRSRAVQCSGFSEAETERSKSSSISGWCHKADHYEILQNDFKMSDKASDRIEGWFTCVDVLERLLYHSTERDVLLDFKYWDDPADSVRPNEGTLLPLWKFPKPASTYPSMVTALAWNPVHDDLFAVGPQSKEAILLPASVLCLDFHPVDAHLLAVGCSNGTVHIVDCQSLDKITSASKGPELMDSAVTQIRWIKQHMGPSPCFLASSIKGEITEWKMNVSVSKGIFLELVGSCRLTVPPRSLFSSNGCPPHQLEFPAPILCFDIDPMTNRLILGNQDGSMACAFAPSCGSRSQHSSNNGDCHDGPVVSVAWRDVSSYESDAASTSHLALLTASSDWSVRLWDSLTTDGSLTLLETFDMGAAVADVAWSPACSTIFGAVTESGVAHVYDMAKGVCKPLCTQRIVSSKVTLTRLAFNPLHRAIVAVGDGRGCVHCFKLSPNLRGASSGGDTLNGGHRNETGGGMRTVVTRRARQKKMENGENASCRQKDTESIKAVSPQMPMEPLRQVLKNARLRREAEVCFDSL